MMADYFVFPVMQLGVWRLERPAEFAVSAGRAGINLRSGRVRVESNIFSRGNLNGIGNVRWSILLWRCLSYSKSRQQKEETDCCGDMEHESSHDFEL